MKNENNNYSEELKRFITTVSKEVAEDKTDGILGKIVTITSGEREVYEFIVAEGYDVTYVEFLAYYKTCQEGVSVVNGELSDADLDSVAGGWSIGGAISSAASSVSNTVSGAVSYVADNPGAFVGGASGVGTGIGGATGVVSGALIGGAVGALFAGTAIIPGAGLGATVGTAVGIGVGATVGGVVGMGTVLAANAIAN